MYIHTSVLARSIALPPSLPAVSFFPLKQQSSQPSVELLPRLHWPFCAPLVLACVHARVLLTAHIPILVPPYSLSQCLSVFLSSVLLSILQERCNPHANPPCMKERDKQEREETHPPATSTPAGCGEGGCKAREKRQCEGTGDGCCAGWGAAKRQGKKPGRCLKPARHDLGIKNYAVDHFKAISGSERSLRQDEHPREKKSCMAKPLRQLGPRARRGGDE
jgi:hypothetical protein